jgi:hypothetical protein
MRKFLKEFWDVLVERHKIHKAMRLLAKQEWSIEFLTALVVRAARVARQSLELELVSAGGQRIIIRSTDTPPARLPDDNIFNHLDDDAKIRAFMREVNRK